MSQKIIHANCIEYMRSIEPGSVDVVITSPPYNLDIKYASYKDDQPRQAYLQWTKQWVDEVKRVLHPNGSFFLNVGGSSNDPWIPIEVACVVRETGFILQNNIVWAKSICLGEDSFGHFKPINSSRYLNGLHESIFHFTQTGKVQVDRLAIGVPFADKSNIARWGHAHDRRCRGNIWFIPYKTIQKKEEKGSHPAIFPVELPEMCIKLHGLEKTKFVYDPFGGIGTTALACKKLNLDCVCTDLDAAYCDIAHKRLASSEVSEMLQSNNSNRGSGETMDAPSGDSKRLDV